jgi:hypothetical protein
MTDANPTIRARAGRALTRFFVFVLLVAMAGGIGFLLSILNAHTYSLKVLDGKLTVYKGKMFPIGADPFRPSDSRLADAYAPIPLEGRAAGSLEGQRFTDRDDLDRALFTFLKDLADPKVDSDDPKKVDDGIALLSRMEKLSGITDDQRAALGRMKAEVAFDQAKLQLDEARRLIANALAQLKLAAESRTRHAENAHQMVSEVEPAAKQLEEVLRTAVHTTAIQGEDGSEEREPTPMPAAPVQRLPAPTTPAPAPQPAPMQPAPSTSDGQ